jgi:hypothetical protein
MTLVLSNMYNELHFVLDMLILFYKYLAGNVVMGKE